MGAAVFAVHSWSVRGFLYNLPSFLLKYDTGQILAVFCYHMALAFLESMGVMGALLLASAALPSQLLRRGFLYKGLLVLAAASAAAVFLQYSYVSETFAFEGAGRSRFFIEAAAGLAVFLALYIASFRAIWLQSALGWVAEQVSVMLFVYLPLDLVGLLVVAVRLVR